MKDEKNYSYDSVIWPTLTGHLYNITWINFSYLPSLEDNNITVSLQKGGIVYGWLATEETSCKSYSITFLNVDNSTL